jgi:hypothetical protein
MIQVYCIIHLSLFVFMRDFLRYKDLFRLYMRESRAQPVLPISANKKNLQETGTVKWKQMES